MRSASADNPGGCATPKVEFWHPARLNQMFPNMVFDPDAMMQQPRVNNQNVKFEWHILKKI